MTLKHKQEWTDLIKLGKKHTLLEAQIIFLLALREVSPNEPSYGFGIKDVKGTSLEEQALWAIGSIKRNEKRRQEYIISQSHMDFIEFFCYFGGPFGTGWFPRETNKMYELKKLTKEIEDELKGNKEMG